MKLARRSARTAGTDTQALLWQKRQGVASHTLHEDVDNTLQGDLTYKAGPHTLGAGFYIGSYDITSEGSSLVFPADNSGAQTSAVPVDVSTNAHSVEVLSGIYINDLGRSTQRYVPTRGCAGMI